MFYSWQAAFNQGDDLTIRFALVILILLSARQNLRQYYFVNIIEKLITEKSQAPSETSGDTML